MTLGHTFLRLLLFGGLNLLAACFARGLSRRLLPQAESTTRAVAGLVIYFYTVIAGLTLIVKIQLLPVCLLAVLAGGVGWRLGRKTPPRLITPDQPARSWMGAILVGAILVMVTGILINALAHPRFFHDPMTYQLAFAAQWLQQGRITLMPTPFGDPSQAYAPSNMSLYYLWLMLPLHSDRFALCGQFPFLLLALFAVTGLAKQLEIPRPWHLLPSLFLLASPMVREQAASAYSDLALAGLFAAALFFFLRARQTREPASFILGAMALGLMLGTKYNSLPLALLALPLLLAGWGAWFRNSSRGLSLTLLALLLLALGGGYWYLRNFWATGSPVYPFRIEILGRAILGGVYGRPEMLNWIYHREGIPAWKETVQALSSFGLVLLYALAAAVVVPGLALRRKITLLSGYVLILPLLVDRINWHLIPFQVDRFWLPALVLAPLSLAALTLWQRRMGYLLLAVAILGLAGSRVERPEVESPGGQSRREQALGSWEFGPAWNALAGQPGPFTVADTGNNLPYPLYGPRLDRRVLYVKVNNHPGFRFHDYLRLAGGNGFNTPEPAPYRLELDIAAWWNNLTREQVKYLFVTRLGEAELLNIEHDETGWPTEKSWADRHLELFEPVYADPLVRIYRLHLSARPNWGEADRPLIRPMDAIEAYTESEELGRRWFPHADQAIRKYNLTRQSRN